MISGCDELDHCLDAGGAWDDEIDQCICTDREREKYGDVPINEGIELCAAEYETVKAQKATSE